MTATSPRYRRQKGHSFEREIANQFREELGFTDCQTTRNARGGNWAQTDDGSDLVGTLPWKVQCKRYADYVPVRTIEEIVHDPLSEIPLLLTKCDNGPTMAVLPWAELKKLIHPTMTMLVCDDPKMIEKAREIMDLDSSAPIDISKNTKQLVDEGLC